MWIVCFVLLWYWWRGFVFVYLFEGICGNCLLVNNFDVILSEIFVVKIFGCLCVKVEWFFFFNFFNKCVFLWRVILIIVLEL